MGFTLFFPPPRLFQGFRDDPLQLAIDGAELVSGPFLHRFHCLCIDTKQEGLGIDAIILFFRHNHLSKEVPKV